MKLLTADQLDVALDYEAVAAAGSLLGSAGIIVMDERANMVEVARRTVFLLSRESLVASAPPVARAQAG
jgi:NADH-quinone oxidoreductase subunit F